MTDQLTDLYILYTGKENLQEKFQPSILLNISKEISNSPLPFQTDGHFEYKE